MKVALLTVSDSAAAGEKSDLCGPVLHKTVAEAGWTVVSSDIVPRNRMMLAKWLVRAADEQHVDLILTSGATGLGPRDVTPEATRDVISREAPGIPEAIRVAEAFVTPEAILSRAVAGVRGETLIINLSGNPKFATKQWATFAPIIETAVESLRVANDQSQARGPENKAARTASSKPITDPQSSPKGTFLGQAQQDLVKK